MNFPTVEKWHPKFTADPLGGHRSQSDHAGSQLQDRGEIWFAGQEIPQTDYFLLSLVSWLQKKGLGQVTLQLSMVACALTLIDLSITISITN